MPLIDEERGEVYLTAAEQRAQARERAADLLAQVVAAVVPLREKMVALSGLLKAHAETDAGRAYSPKGFDWEDIYGTLDDGLPPADENQLRAEAERGCEVMAERECIY